MKDKKFAILLFLVIFLVLINIIWLIKFYDDEFRVRSLTVVDEQNKSRIQLTTWENKAAIDFLDYKEQIIARFFAYIYEDTPNKAGLEIIQFPWSESSAWAAGIRITTGVEPEIELIDTYGQGIQIQANKIKTFPLGTWRP